MCLILAAMENKGIVDMSTIKIKAKKEGYKGLGYSATIFNNYKDELVRKGILKKLKNYGEKDLRKQIYQLNLKKFDNYIERYNEETKENTSLNKALKISLLLDLLNEIPYSKKLIEQLKQEIINKNKIDEKTMNKYDKLYQETGKKVIHRLIFELKS